MAQIALTSTFTALDLSLKASYSSASAAVNGDTWEEESYLDAVDRAAKLIEESLQLVRLVSEPHCQHNYRIIPCLLVSPLFQIGQTNRLETQHISCLKQSGVWVENYIISTPTQVPFTGHGIANDPALRHFKAFYANNS